MSKPRVTTVVDVIEAACGNALTPNLFGRHRKFNSKDRKRIAEAHRNYEELTQDFRVPERGMYEVFPYVHPGWRVAKLVGGHGYEAELTDEVDKAIKSLLLYYHRLALPDGFGHLCDHFVLAPYAQSAETEAKFDAYLRLFAKLRPLIQDRIVSFLPERPTWRRANEHVDALEEILRFKVHLPHIRDEKHLMRLIEESLWIGKQFDLDLLLPTPAMVKFFNEYVGLCQRRISQTEIREASLGQMLLTAELPQLEKLTFNDIVAVRSNDEGFTSWRRALGNVMQACYEDYSDGNMSQREFGRLAHEEMAEGRARVEESINSSHYLSLAKSAASSVGVGLFATVAATPETFMEGASTALATAGGTFLLDYAIGKKKGRKDGALRAHYAVFGG